MKTLMIESVEVREDKNENTFHVLEISTPSLVFTKSADGSMKAIKQRSRTVKGITGWVVSNLESMNGRPDYEATLEEGDEIQGDIITRKVKSYFIADRPGTAKDKQGPVKKEGKTGRLVDTASVVVFADTDDSESFEVATAVAFKRKGHVLADQSVAQAAVINQTTQDPILAGEDDEDEKPKAKQANKSR